MHNQSPRSSRTVSATTRRKASWIAGAALVLMAVLAPLAQFGVLENLVTPGDASATVANIVSSPGLMRMAGIAFVVVALLDLAVAWALHFVFREENRLGSLLTAWLRTIYGAVLAVATMNLFDVARVASGSALEPGERQTEMLGALSSFHIGYEGVGLGIFSIHLFGLGYLVYKSVDFPKFLGVLLAFAGAGYLFDSLVQMLAPEHGLTIAQYTFVGEAMLIFWLVWHGIKGFPTESHLPSGTVQKPPASTSGVR